MFETVKEKKKIFSLKEKADDMILAYKYVGGANWLIDIGQVGTRELICILRLWEHFTCDL